MNNTQVEVLNKVSTLCEYIMINGKNSDFKNVNESLKKLLEDVNNFPPSFRARFGELGCMTDDSILELMSDELLDGWTVQVVLIAVELHKKCKTYKKKLTE